MVPANISSGHDVIEVFETQSPSVPRFKIEFESASESRVSPLTPMPSSPLDGLECVDQDYESAATCGGKLPLYLNSALFEAVFPRLAKCMARDQAAALLATTRLVGMQCPGLNSLFQSLEIHFKTTTADPSPPTYRVEKADQRFSRLVLAIESESNWLTGRLDTFCRPPQAQPSYADLRDLVSTGEFSGLRALVIGGSRGIGEVASKLLAAGGADTRMTYYLGADDAMRICDEIQLAGATCQSFVVDVAGSPAAMYEQLADGLDGWVPDLCVYRATPPIDMEARPDFSADLLSRYTQFYVIAFEGLVRWLLNRSAAGLRVLYPSTVTIDTPIPWSKEYAAAKTSGEECCRKLQAEEPRLRVSVPRFPRVETDQTSTFYPTESSEIGPLVLEHLREIYRSEA